MILLWLVFALLVFFLIIIQLVFFFKMVIHKNVYLYHDIAMILVTKITIFSTTIPLTYHTNLTFKSSRHKYPDILFFFKCAVCVYT